MDLKGLLFVHKNTSSTSLSRSASQKESQDINRHVQRGRKHERYKKINVQKWHRPFLARRSTNPPQTQSEAVRPQIEKKPASSLRSASDTSVQFIRFDPTKAAPEDSHAIRSNAVRYQWERSKEVRSQGRKSKVPIEAQQREQIQDQLPKAGKFKNSEPSDLSSVRKPGPWRDREVNGNAHSAQTSKSSGTRPSENEQLLTVPPPNRSSSLQPGGYPTDLPLSTVAPLLHLGKPLTFSFCGRECSS